LLGDREDQCTDLGCSGRPTGAGHQPPMPLQERAGAHQTGEPLESLRIDFAGFDRQATPLVIAEARPLAQLVFETLTSSWRYSMTCCWLRLSQPAKQNSKSWSWFTAGACIGNRSLGQNPCSALYRLCLKSAPLLRMEDVNFRTVRAQVSSAQKAPNNAPSSAGYERLQPRLGCQ